MPKDQKVNLVNLDDLLGLLKEANDFAPGQIDRVRQIGESQAADELSFGGMAVPGFAGITGNARNRLVDLDPGTFKTGPARPDPTKCPTCGRAYAAKGG